MDASSAWLISVHGDEASFARNIAADPRVRLRIRGRWYEGTAILMPLDAAALRHFNRYARLGQRATGLDAKLVRVDFG